MKPSSFPYHSILFSIYPVAYLYARNIVFVRFEDTVVSLAMSVGITLFFLLSFRMILKGWEKAGIICSLMVNMFFSFGHAANQLEGILARYKSTPFNITILAWVWLILFICLAFVALRVKLPKASTLFLNIVGMVLIIFPMWTIISTTTSLMDVNLQKDLEKLAEIRGEKEAEAFIGKHPANLNPDIYYIILDSYERTDMLAEHYGYDNSTFIKALKERGFYVATSSRSNYLNTTYSLNTALNLTYFGNFPKNLLSNSKSNLQTNHVSDFLRKQGYKIIVFDSGTGDTNDQYSDVFIAPESSQTKSKAVINPFDMLLIRTTVGLMMFKGQNSGNTGEEDNSVAAATINRELAERRERIANALTHLPDYAAKDGSYFLFAHIYLPHIPFLYGPGGKELTYQKNMSIYWFEPQPEDYVEQYVYQIQYENEAVLRMIDTILSKTKKPVAIILQSDHGDDHFLDWYQPTDQGVNIRSSTLNAMYFSDGSYETLYPTMTTVNTFRLVFNHWFGTKYPLLPEKVFYHVHSATTARGAVPVFLDACAQFNVCIPAIPSRQVSK